ncbi:MAG: hypothetical protein ACC656_02980 [Candidatus Heimdallarchaeota archaeon]
MMTEEKSSSNPYDQADLRICIWKPTLKKIGENQTQELKFPCRFPDIKKTADICTPCLMGDVFAMQYAQTQEMKKQQKLMQEQQSIGDEVMAYLRNMTSDDSLDDLK